MSEQKKKDVIRPTDDEARRLAKGLIHTSLFGSLAVLEPETGYPFVSRVGVSVDVDGSPYILISTLSAHTSGLKQDPRASLMVGSPGKGDPLAHPRLSLSGQFEKVERTSDEHERLRARYLLRHPKAKLYIDFPDFAFFRMNMERGSLNGGFGKAFLLSPDDLHSRCEDMERFCASEGSAVAHMNDDHADATRLYGTVLCKGGEGAWLLAGIDPEGMDLVLSGTVVRYWFENTIEAGQIKSTLIDLLKVARAQ
ncbi:HugZ family protein [Rhodobacteraceae bacterium RKSG542]|uniref:HugZ family pyridoxamine 5'-phosphate oxidase n=1 Tax=Pseudovibrio flavus TaxID=2529854 RepID=UPI0012BD6ACD|nr:DUF2470 domain-containing protein [Pseudovibrio flavus]MTI19121.1 HugZ family protein [Pseudovibrio flavus]